MEFQLGIGSQIFKEEPNETISYQKHGDYFTWLRCFCFHSFADDGKRNYKQYQSFEKAGKEVGVHSQEGIHLWIHMKDIKVVKY